MDTSDMSVSDLNYMYQHGDYQLKNLATARLSAMQMAQRLSQRSALSRKPRTVRKNATGVEKQREVIG